VAASRLDLATALGATAVGSALDGEFDVVIDAVGLPATRASSVQRLAPGGAAVWLGLMTPDAGFDATELIRQEKRVLGSFAYTDAEFGTAVAMAPGCELGWIDAFPLADSAAVFTELMHGRTDIVKAVLRP
jgi:threonine dehydrogenase-like Zn-dependent dehydrogenase